jgi:hypothetical protein
MTANITPIIANTNSFGDWLFKTNEVIDFVSNNVPSTENPVSGNVVIDGTLETTDFYATTIYGGEISTPGDLELASNTVFSANVSFTGNTVNMGGPARYILTGSNATHFMVGANTSTGRLRFVKGAVLDANNSGSLTVTNFVQANAVYAVSVSGGTQATPNTLNVISEVLISNNVSVQADVDITSNNFAVNTSLFELSSANLSINTVDLDLTGNTGTFVFNTVSASVANLTFTDTSVTAINTDITIAGNSDLVIEGLTGPNNVRDSINTLKQDVLSFAIALG